MPNLYEILDSANQGEAIAVLGGELGLTPQQTQSAVTALLPAISAGLKQSTSTVDGLGNLFALLAQQKDLPALYDDAKLALSPGGLAAGNQALSFIFGSPGVSGGIVDQAQKFSGVDSGSLEKLLPALTGIVLSGLLRIEASEPAPLAAQGALSPLGGAGGGLGDILGQVLGRVLTGSGSAPAPAPAPSPGGLGPLGDILGQIFGGGAPSGPASGPAQQSPGFPIPAPADTGGQGMPGGGLLGAILTQVLKGIQNGTIKPVIISGGGPIQIPMPGGQAPSGSDAPQQIPGGDIFGKILRDVLGGAAGGGAPGGGGPVQLPQGGGAQAPQQPPQQPPSPHMKDLSDLTRQLGVMGGAGSAVFGEQFEHGQNVDQGHLDNIQSALQQR